MTETREGRPNKGGRPKGVRNKMTREIIAHHAKTGEMPLDYMLRVMRDKKAKIERRDHMCIAAARYLHPTLQSIEHSGNVRMTHEQALKDLAGVKR